MSRIGKKPIALPTGVTAAVESGTLTVKGPKGELSRELHPDISVGREDGNLVVTRPTEQKHHRQLHGLTRTLVNNMVVGVTTGYRKGLEITGVGYRAALVGKCDPTGHVHRVLAYAWVLFAVTSQPHRHCAVHMRSVVQTVGQLKLERAPVDRIDERVDTRQRLPFTHPA